MASHPIITAQNIPVTNPDNLRPAYSNFFGASATMTDFTLFFLEVGQVPGPKGPEQQQVVKSIVTLPMGAIEGLQDVLRQLLEQNQKTKQQLEKATASAKK